jgi:adenosylcobinamide kinase/adenosylcobinamide-phosphate guanylyltransferase
MSSMLSEAVSSRKRALNGDAPMTCTLVLGGARSGKSAYAEKLAIASGKEVVYIATATGGDQEMNARITRHRHDRPASWITVEEPLELAKVINHWTTRERVILVDCLTLWLTNTLFKEGEDTPAVGAISLSPAFTRRRAELLEVIGKSNRDHSVGCVILVSNEVGMGIVPLGAASRCFVDEAGRLHQAIAALCDRAVLVVAGLPLALKEPEC